MVNNSNIPQALTDIVGLLRGLYDYLTHLLENPLLLGLIEVAVILVIALVFTKIVSVIVSRLEYRGIIAKPVGMKIRSITTTATYIVALIAIAYTLTGVETLLIPLFIVFAAILFSMWEFFANIMGYYTILASKMILQDTYVRIGEYEGKVTDITPLSIILEAPDGSVIRVPNRYVFLKPVKTPSRRIALHLKVKVNGVPLGHTTRIAEKIKEIIKSKTKRGSVPGMNVDVVVTKIEGNSTNYDVRISVPRNLYHSIKDDLINESTMIILSELEEYDVSIEYLGAED